MYVVNRINLGYLPNVCTIKSSNITEAVANTMLKSNEILSTIKDIGIKERVEQNIGKELTEGGVKGRYAKGDVIMIITYYGPKREKDGDISKGKLEYKVLVIE